jgi:colanic acid biosynthesis glycosyl transferase WcaI
VHILVIGINYWPEETSVAPFTTGLCQHLVEAGHRVSVITAFPYYPEWRIRDAYRGRIYKRESVSGVDVRRVWHYVPRRPRGLVERLLHDITFSLSALMAACAVRKVDAIFCSSPPPFVPVVAWLHARARRVPHAIKVTDLATDAAVSTGIMVAGPLVRLARSLERFNYSRAQGVSVLCSGFEKRLVELGVPVDRVFVVTDWADTVHVRPLDRENQFRQAQGYDPADFVVLHAGSMGLKQKLETVLESAILAEKSGLPVKWLLVGDGEERERLERLTKESGLASVRFLKLLPAETLPYALASANAVLLTQQASVTDSVIPSKLLTYMASGRAILASINPASEAARRINDASCGVVVAPEDPRALLEGIMALRDLGPAVDDMGRRGREYVEAHFSKERVLQDYDRFFCAVFGEESQ